MFHTTLSQSVDELSVNDTLAIIEAITQMLQHELTVNGSTQPQNGATDEKLAAMSTGQQSMKALIAELFSGPTPPPEKMLRRGMFKGRVPVDEELFKLAEWHPTDEELADG